MLAIVIPYFKITYFEETLDSLANQTNQSFHLYIGDDASPNDPSGILEKYKTKIDFNLIRFKENLGGISLVQQWDRCLQMVQNETWIMLLCDDDVLSPNVVQEFYDQLPKIEENKSKVVRFASQEIDGRGKSISKVYLHPKLQDFSDSFYQRFFRGSRSSMSEYIFSRSSYLKYGFRDIALAWHADDLAWIEFSEFEPIYTINEALVYFRLSGENISRHGYLQKEKEELRYQFFTIVVDEYLRKFKAEHRKEILRKYELLTYERGGGNLQFWRKLLPLIYLHRGTWETLKFTRRIYINYGKKSLHNYSKL